MSSFAHAIRSFRGGALSKDRLLSEVDRQLSRESVEPHALLDILKDEHAAAPLPADVHRALSQRISGAGEPTILRHAEMEPQLDPARTVLLGDGEAAALAARKPQGAPDVGALLQGRFKLIELVGVGGMSRVYKAVDLRRVEAGAEDPHLAIKVLTIPFSEHFGSLAALHREADKLQSLTHPNIVRVIDCDRDGHTVFMTMEFLDGAPLSRRLGRPIGKPLPADEVARIVRAIGDALEFAHEKGVVHADLKPGNVIVTANGEVKVIDFGIARMLGRAPDCTLAPDAPTWEAAALTPSYASPEMLESRPPDPRDDVYALACIAYELLTGAHPLMRQSATTARNARMRPQRRPEVTPQQFKAILRGLEFERSRRTPSARAFCEEFLRPPRSLRRSLTIGAAALAAVAVGAGAIWLLEPPAQRERSEPVAASQPALAPADAFRDCPTCPLMRVLPPDAFVQGSTLATYEQPQRLVTITHAFAMGVHEVTIAEFREFVEATGFAESGCTVYEREWVHRADATWSSGDGASAAHPVACVSWDDAEAYAQWLSSVTGETYRLPSASEWEYAARAGAEAASAKLDCDAANVADESAAARYPGWDAAACTDGAVHAAPVGSFAANAFGLHDTLGNVFEWVQDCWRDDYEGAAVDGSPYFDSVCAERELRGGSWFTTPAYVRPTYRNRFPSDHRSSSIGFRLVREIRP